MSINDIELSSSIYHEQFISVRVATWNLYSSSAKWLQSLRITADVVSDRLPKLFVKRRPDWEVFLGAGTSPEHFSDIARVFCFLSHEITSTQTWESQDLVGGQRAERKMVFQVGGYEKNVSLLASMEN